MSPSRIRDLRSYARQTNIQLFVGFVLLLLVVGLGLIDIIYGRQAAMLGLACILIGLAPMLLIGLALLGIDWVVKLARRDD